MKKFIPIVLSIAILLSCTKEDRQQFPFTLISSKYQVTSYPKVYTRLGEITDRAVVNAYVNSPNGNYFYLTADTTITAASDTIILQSSDTALFSNMPREWGTRIIKKQDGLIYFYMTDTLPGFKTGESLLIGIEKNIGIFKPYTKDFCFSTGTCPYQEVYDAFIATGGREHFEFPLLTYKITRTTSLSSSVTARQNFNNLFNPSVISLLQNGDTLAVQTLKRVYSKQ